MTRWAWLGFGWAMVGLGLVGVVTPVLPTTIFLILAAWAFGHSSPRLRAWLVGHPRLGPPILDWEERGAISRRSKTFATATMAAVLALSVLLGLPLWVTGLQAALMGGAAAYILTRPC